MSFTFVPSEQNPATTYVYDDNSPGAMAFAAVTRYPDGSISVSVASEIEVYRDGVKLSENGNHVPD